MLSGRVAVTYVPQNLQGEETATRPTAITSRANYREDTATRLPRLWCWNFAQDYDSACAYWIWGV